MTRFNEPCRFLVGLRGLYPRTKKRATGTLFAASRRAVLASRWLATKQKQHRLSSVLFSFGKAEQ